MTSVQEKPQTKVSYLYEDAVGVLHSIKRCWFADEPGFSLPCKKENWKEKLKQGCALCPQCSLGKIFYESLQLQNEPKSQQVLVCSWPRGGWDKQTSNMASIELETYLGEFIEVSPKAWLGFVSEESLSCWQFIFTNVVLAPAWCTPQHAEVFWRLYQDLKKKSLSLDQLWHTARILVN